MRHVIAPLLALLISLAPLPAAETATPGQRLHAIQNRLPECGRKIDALRSSGQDVSYPLVTYTVLRNFVPWAIEDLEVSVPLGWGLLPVNGCQATYEPVRDARTGEWAIKIINKTPLTPNVYGLFEHADVITLKEGKPYTLSLWARTDDPGRATLTVDAGWGKRLELATTGGQWKRFELTFTPAAADLAFKPRLLSETVTPGFVFDDWCLVEGETAETGKNLIPNSSFEESWSATRVARELGDMETMVARLEAQLATGNALPRVPRWDGKARPTIKGPSFVDATGRPVFFVGYGHFSHVRDDTEKFPAYGVNLVQHAEFGPSAVFPKQDVTDDAPVERLIDHLDRAAKAGVAVDFLISPHYFPGWIFEKFPELRKGRADFFPWSVYHPQGRALVKRFVDHVMPRIKDKPALLSVCLTNEPINVQDPDEFSIAAWRAWLKARHGDVATLNARWNCDYNTFDEIPQPNALNRSAEPRPGGAWCDFVRWNQEFFADFHKELADMVHAVAPDVPVHAKATTWHMYRGDGVLSGDDPTLLGAVTDINGNDSVNLWGFNQRSGGLIERGSTDFAQGWRENAIGYELQRSNHDAPVFNSENHLIFDREMRYVDPSHIRAALWMGAIHGQSATTLWVWAREMSNPRSDFAGSITERAGCAEAVGIVNHDLNRVATEITALQNAPADVLILHSNTSAVWDGHRYDTLIKLYTSLSFTGVKPGFLSERQLERGELRTAPILFIPDCVHISDAAFAELKRFRGRIVFAGGDDLLTKNEYDQARSEKLQGTPLKLGKTWQEALDALARVELSPAIRVKTHDAAWGVQWQTARTTDGLVVNLYNAGHDPITVSIAPPGAYVDLLDGQTLRPEQKFILKPLEVRLLRSIEGKADKAATLLDNARWQARDLVKGGDEGLRLEPRADGNSTSCTVVDTTGGGRAVTMSLVLPLDATGGTWCDDPERSRVIDDRTSYSNLADNAGGVENSASRYPLAVVVKGEKAVCLAVPPNEPRMVRFVYDAAAGELRAEFDFGLSPIPVHFPSRADGKVIAFEVPSRWAFRRAVEKYHAMFPEVFARRVKTAGLWMPFAEIGGIREARDFGFAFHTIAQTQADPRILGDDDRLTCGSYLYVEPQTYWQQASGGYQERLDQLEKEARDGSGMARGTLVSGILRDTGKRDLYLDGVAYTTQKPWGSCADPAIVDPDASRNWHGKGTYAFEQMATHLGWRDKPPMGVDGVMLDSSEGWGEILNYNREHWKVTSYPLTFDPWTKKVALLNFWGTVAWARKMSGALRERGMLLQANDVFFRRWQLAPWVDAPGREYTWTDESGKLKVVEDERYLFFRTMSGRKPYLMVMNNDYDDGSIMEPYFQRSVFYATWPGFYFSHKSADAPWYWSNPAWYERDRPLFRKYLPMIRKLDEAGWQPVPHATCEPPVVRVERYGSMPDGNLAFAVYNPLQVERRVEIRLHQEPLDLGREFAAREWFGEADLPVRDGGVTLKLPAQGYNVISITRAPAAHGRAADADPPHVFSLSVSRPGK